MPVSAAVELHIYRSIDGIVTFIDQDEISVEIPIALWRDLGKPLKLRIRFEDAWNDPNREWE